MKPVPRYIKETQQEFEAVTAVNLNGRYGWLSNSLR
jgi:hypothetical protein